MRLSWYHLIAFVSFAAIAATIAVRACLIYNEIAGTDKTPLHIGTIALGVVMGPMTGPIANSGEMGGPGAHPLDSHLVCCAARYSDAICLRKDPSIACYACSGMVRLSIGMSGMVRLLDRLPWPLPELILEITNKASAV